MLTLLCIATSAIVTLLYWIWWSWWWKRHRNVIVLVPERLRCDEDGAILLDRNNPKHREWYEDDE